MPYNTKCINISFLKMTQELKKLGVKDYLFPIYVNDPSVIGLDPYSKDLTTDQKYAIFNETKNNLMYFASYARLPSQGGTTMPVELNIGRLAILFCFMRNCNSIVNLNRQSGKTTLNMLAMLWAACFRTRNTNIYLLHKSQDGSTEDLKRIQEMKELLPKWILNIICQREDKNNITEKRISYLNNTIKALPAANSIPRGDNLGRGCTSSLIFFDEIATMPFNKTIFNAITPAFSSAKLQAIRNNAPHVFCMATTPSTLIRPEAQFAFGLIQNAVRFNKSMFDMDEQELDDYVQKNSSNNFTYIEYSYKELGYSEEWFRDQCRQLNNDAEAIHRDLLLQWTSSGEGLYFSEEMLDKVKMHVKPVKFTLKVNGYEIKFFDTPEPSRNYVISCDAAVGSDKDRSAFVIIDPATFKIIGTFMNAHLDTDEYRKLIYNLATIYFPNSIVIIERNSVGAAILDVLKKTSLEPRLYREMAERSAETTLSDGKIVKSKTNKLIYGVDTTSKSRNIMIGILYNLVDEHPEIFQSEDLFKELQSLEKNPKTGKVEAMQGTHDDLVMATCFFYYAVKFGKSFQRLFHISGIPVPENAHDGNYMTDSLNNYNAMMKSATINAYQMATGNIQNSMSNQFIATAKDMLEKDKISQENYKENIKNNMLDFINKMNE